MSSPTPAEESTRNEKHLLSIEAPECIPAAVHITSEPFRVRVVAPESATFAGKDFQREKLALRGSGGTELFHRMLTLPLHGAHHARPSPFLEIIANLCTLDSVRLHCPQRIIYLDGTVSHGGKTRLCNDHRIWVQIIHSVDPREHKRL